ncbi:isoprenyl transferase [Oceanobacillus longus]|uniref:Isoprenyl transferase n=1 Tax=Oceanobacillus longus TaxID=930120 RepID=A0ABV8GT99_9BACI
MSRKIPFFNTKKTKEIETETEGIAPKHVAIIMDGNGRWAQKRGLPRIAGHKEGVTAVNKIVKEAVKSNVKILTLYTFSTENWKRPKSEIDFILRLPKEFLHIYLPELISNNVRIDTIGDFDALPDYTKDAVQYAVDKTKNNDGLLLNFALNYGSRLEIVHAVKQIINDIDESKLLIDSLDDNQFSKYLFTNGLSDPDLLIRTGGEQRLSNFMLWQLAYTEFCFSDVLWPDFNETNFKNAIEDYKQRKRRYGGI